MKTIKGIVIATCLLALALFAYKAYDTVKRVKETTNLARGN